MASVTTLAPSARTIPDPDVDTEWTMDDFGLWIDKAMSTTFGHTDRVAGARAFWMEWSRVEQFFPHKIRQGTIQLMNKKLQSAEFPSLRELVRLQDGSECG